MMRPAILKQHNILLVRVCCHEKIFCIFCVVLRNVSGINDKVTFSSLYSDNEHFRRSAIVASVFECLLLICEEHGISFWPNVIKYLTAI